MGQGQDKIARNLIDLQPTAIVELFVLYFNTIDQPGEFVAFHGGSLFGGDLLWQNTPYSAIPVETEGFEINGNGQMPRPKIRVANKDYFITKLLNDNNDFLHAKLIRKRTFVKFLDDKNFDGGNPWGEADSSAELSNDTFLFSQKTAENKSFVEFELSTPLDLENFDLTNRLVLSRYCPWRYRGAGCNYIGPPIETEDLQPITIDDNYITKWTTSQQHETIEEWAIGTDYPSGAPTYIVNKEIKINNTIPGVVSSTVNTDLFYKDWYVSRVNHKSTLANKPYGTNSFWLKDGCSKKLSACRKRFINDIGINASANDIKFVRNYVDFSPIVSNPTNNVAYSWDFVSGYPNEDVASSYFFTNAVDSNTDSYFNPYSTYWKASNVASGVFYLNDFTGVVDKLTDVNVDRINVYNTYRTNKFGTSAKISITRRDGTVVNNTVPEIVDNSTTGRFTLTGYFTGMSGVSISGSGGYGIPSLDQVEILDYRRNRGLINYDFISEKIHLNEGFLIGMWTEFPKGTSDSKKINFVHNVSSGNQYSGFNVYLQGQDIFCDFAVVSVSGNPAVSTIIKKSISADASNFISAGRRVLFLESYQSNGHSTGQPLGRIRLADELGLTIVDYYTATRNTSIKFSGEYFLFKDPTKQNGIGPLSFAINQWENYDKGLVYTSPIKLGSIAIWDTHGDGDGGLKYRGFGRNDSAELEEFYEFKSFSKSYQRTLKNNLFAWWDSDLTQRLTDYSNYNILSQNHGNTNVNINYLGEDYSYGDSYLHLTGNFYNGLVANTPFYRKVINYSSYSIPSPTTPIPFGGFPGTDKYGH